jgi:hypothetical protein
MSSLGYSCSLAIETYTAEEAGFTSSSGSVRALSVNAKKELGSEER